MLETRPPFRIILYWTTLPAGAVITRQEGAAEQRFHAQKCKGVATEKFSAHELRLRAAGQTQILKAHREDILENPVLLPNVEVLAYGVRPAWLTLFQRVDAEIHDAVEVFVGKRFEQYRVYHAEDSRGRANAEGQ